MGRIADAAVSLLAAGPASMAELGARLAGSGVTRARDPIAAVRRALRSDPRVIEVPDGRVARVDLVLDGVVLTTVVGRDALAEGACTVDGDLAPLMLIDVGNVGLPDGVAEGDIVAVTVRDAMSGVLDVRCITPPQANPAQERALIDAVRLRLDRPWPVPPVVHLATVFALVAGAGAFRSPGRPLTDVLRDGGWEVHLGWVGPAGTPWRDLTEQEVDALEADVAGLLILERHAAAAAVQDRLVNVLRRHLPDRVPAARRRLARVLARAGRLEEGSRILTGAFAFDDPEDRYEAALLALRRDEVSAARRYAEEGLARTPDPGSEVARCLEDLAGDLDAQADYRRAMDRIDATEHADDLPRAVATGIVTPRRSYLVETMIETLMTGADPEDVGALLEAMGDVPDVGADACLACAAVLPEPLSSLARSAARGAVPRRPWIAGLLEALPVAAWSTARSTVADQHQLVIGVRREEGRIGALVVLIDHDDLDGAAKEAFFLPDLAPQRLERELFGPMAEFGLPCHPVPLDAAIAELAEALRRTAHIGWRLPSESGQPVHARIHRWVLRRFERGLPPGAAGQPGD